jgi:SAM-dependent methyltransferase
VFQRVPILLPAVPPGWKEETERKIRFAARPRWRRRLLNPDLTTKGHQQRRLREFLASFPPGAAIMDVGSSLRRLSADILCLDLIPTPEIDLVGDLHRVPLADATLDAVICNGVLEHVAVPERVVDELWRVLKPGGRIYVSLPFLQGYHPSPTDFHRFTIDGARQLLDRFTIDRLVNTRGSASTVTWILSSFLAELVSFNDRRVYGLAHALFGWLLLPLKYLDYLVAGNRFDHYITSGFTVIGTKPDRAG